MKSTVISTLVSLFIISFQSYGFGSPIPNHSQEFQFPDAVENEEAKGDKSEREEVFERDIILTAEQRDMIFYPGKNDKKNMVLDRWRWPTKTVNGESIVEIPYVYGSGVSSSVKEMHKKVIGKFNSLTCVRFVPRSSEKDYINIYRGDGCYSMVGRTGDKQRFSLGDGCDSPGTIMHESMHAIGFFHEQSRLDRDEFVKINWENIKEGRENQFKKYESYWGIGLAELRKYPYDLHSILSHDNNAFSKNGLPTIEDKQNPGAKVGQKRMFTTGDLFKINSMYNCANKYGHPKTYKITVETSNDWWSGTNARVFMKIFGSSSDSGEIELKKGAFEAGDVDIESHLLPDVTPIQKIIVWHSNQGVGAAWKLEKVTIEDTKSNQKFTFKCNKWLEGDASSNRVVLTP